MLILTALAATLVLFFVLAILSPRVADVYESLALRLGDAAGFIRLGETPVYFEGENGGGGGGDGGDGNGGGENGGGGGSGGGDGGPSQLEQDARAAIDALKAAGAEIPTALSKAVDELAQARREAASYRTQRNGSSAEVKALQEQMAAIAKKLGIEDDDPTKVAAAAEEKAQKLEAENRSLKLGQALSRAAKSKGADEAALADSRSFMTEIEKLDPSDDKFAEALEAAVEKAVKDNPKLKAQAARSGNDLSGNGTGGGGEDRPKTLVDAIAARYAG